MAGLLYMKHFNLIFHQCTGVHFRPPAVKPNTSGLEKAATTSVQPDVQPDVAVHIGPQEIEGPHQLQPHLEGHTTCSMTQTEEACK